MKRVFNMIIVDESGSMSIIKSQALAGLNETIETVKKMQEAHKEIEQRLSLMTFDSSHKTFVFDNVRANAAHKLGRNDYNPCGATPLYDAIGIAIAKLNAQTTDEDNVLVTIITDGEENCSEEYSLRMIKTLIEKMKKHNWTFSFIGTDNLDVEGIANSLSIDNRMTFAQDDEGTKEMFRRERHARERYCACIAEDCEMAPGSLFEE